MRPHMTSSSRASPAAIKPKDVLEEMWVRDVVDLTWETLRMRRLKAALLIVRVMSRGTRGQY